MAADIVELHWTQFVDDDGNWVYYRLYRVVNNPDDPYKLEAYFVHKVCLKTYINEVRFVTLPELPELFKEGVDARDKSNS